jgi:hypothetical protein
MLTKRIRKIVDKQPELINDYRKITKIIWLEDCKNFNITSTEGFLDGWEKGYISSMETVRRTLTNIRKEKG